VKPEEIQALPPVPPAGVLDMRLLVGEVETAQVPVLPGPAAYKMRLQGSDIELGWEMQPIQVDQWEIVLNGTVHALEEIGSLVLDQPLVEVLLRPRTIRPTEYVLGQNFPNPFNPSTTIEYDLKEDGMVSLKIYDILGQQVRELVQEWQPTGRYRVVWDSRNQGGAEVANGIYFYELRSGNYRALRKMLLLK